MITLNYVIFSKFDRYRYISVSVMSDVCLRMCFIDLGS